MSLHALLSLLSIYYTNPTLLLLSVLVPLSVHCKTRCSASTSSPLVATFARHSGGHLNPAISLAAALSGHMAWAAAGMYILAQVRCLHVGTAA
jgi:hypothetical protein